MILSRACREQGEGESLVSSRYTPQPLNQRGPVKPHLEGASRKWQGRNMLSATCGTGLLKSACTVIIIIAVLKMCNQLFRLATVALQCLSDFACGEQERSSQGSCWICEAREKRKSRCIGTFFLITISQKSYCGNTMVEWCYQISIVMELWFAAWYWMVNIFKMHIVYNKLLQRSTGSIYAYFLYH